jgi:hypothetical protein
MRNHQGGRMIDVYGELKDPNVYHRTQKEMRWLNISGFNKCGKTDFAVSLMEKLRVVYLDLEEGTKRFLGPFLMASSLGELRDRYAFVRRNIQTIRPQVIIVDPFDRLYDWVEREYLQQNGLTVLEWKNYGPLRDKVAETLNAWKSLCPLLITITHLNLAAIGKNSNQITYLDMNVNGKVKSWVQDTVDANMLFKRKVDDDGTEYLSCTADDGGTTEMNFHGARIPELYNIRTAVELREYLFAQFAVGIVTKKEAA